METPKNESRHVIIMCGGAGTRLWPLSQANCPKPFLKLPYDQTLIAQSYARACLLVPKQNIWILTTSELKSIARLHLPDVDGGQFMLEPSSKNTGPALTFAMKTLHDKIDSDITCLVLSADHYIPNAEAFIKSAAEAFEAAEKSESIVCLGIQPDTPETGYGYIETGEEVFENTYRVKQFVEKPDINRAEQYLAKKTHVWNCGIFCWKASVYIEEIKVNYPQAYAAFFKDTFEVEAAYREVEKQSIDFALLEKTSHILVVRASFFWTDLGNWEALDKVLRKTSEENICFGPVSVRAGKANLVKSLEKPIRILGLSDIVCIEGPDGILVAKKDLVKDLKCFD